MNGHAPSPPTVRRWALPRVDTVTLLTGYLVLLLLIPSALVVGALGAAGSPATIVSAGYALLVLAWAVMGRVPIPPSARPVAVAAGLVVATVLVSYVAAMSRPINAVEVRAADRGLITVAGWMGLIFLGLYGPISDDRLDRLLRLLVAAVGIGAVVGILQFYSGDSIVDRITIPGLTAHQPPGDVSSRNGFFRPAGMASHPIEFAVSLTMTLPLALHYAMAGRREKASAVRRWWPVAAIALAIPQSLSRSAIVGLVAGMLVVAAGWTWRQRRVALATASLMIVGLYLTIPGMLGTLLGLFTGISADGSATSRTDSYGLAWHFVGQSPVFGRGFSTFLPAYRIVDNQYLLLMIDTGFAGLAATLGLFLTAIIVGFRTVSRAPSPAAGSLARALTASVVVAGAGFATFDAYGFPQVPGLLFLVIGLIGGFPVPRAGPDPSKAGIGDPARATA